MVTLSHLEQLKVKKDGVWAWAICFSAILNNMVVVGIDSSFGVIIGSIIEDLGSNAGTVSWIMSTHDTSMYVFASISATLAQKYGFRLVIIGGVILSCTAYIIAAFCESIPLLLLSYGLLGGAGFGLLYTPGNIVSAYYFEKHLAIATGLVMGGSGLGTVILPLLANELIITHGLSSVFTAFAISSPLSLILGVLVFPVEEETARDDRNNNGLKKNALKVPDSGKICTIQKITNKLESGEDRDAEESQALLNTTETSSLWLVLWEIFNPRLSAGYIETHSIQEDDGYRRVFAKFGLLKDPRMALYCLVLGINELAYDIPCMFLPQMMVVDHGFPRSAVGTIMSILGVSTIIGKFLSGVIAKFFKSNLIVISSTTLLCIGSVITGLAFCSVYEEFIGATVAYGVLRSSIDYYCVHILKEMYGVSDKFQDAYGLIMLAKMPTPIIGPPLAGALHDFFGAYYISFYVAAIFVSIAAVFNFIMFFISFKYYE